MRPKSRPAARALRTVLRTSLFAASGLVAAAPSLAQGVPLEAPAGRIGSFETAHLLAQGRWSFQVGAHQTDPGTGGGTGSQTYYGGVDWAVTPNLQLGFTTQLQEDPPIRPIAGTSPAIRFVTAGASAKYQFVDNGRLAVSALGSVEYLSFRTPLFGTNVAGENNVIGSLHVPVSFRAGRTLELHVTPGVSVFPDNLNGIPYYGTVASIGAGATWQPNPRWQVYGSANVPVSGGNTIAASGAITKEPVLSFGARYAVTPKVALEAYVTNGLGTTPATGILTFWPDGDEALFGLKLHYTPGRDIKPSYRAASLVTPTARTRRLQRDGFTLSAADTISPGKVLVTVSGGDYDNYGGAVYFSPDQDFQIEGIIENFANDGTVPAARNPSNAERFMLGGRLRFLDQQYGDPVSLSGRVLGGRDFGVGGGGVGVLYVDFPVTYRASAQTALNLNPRFAGFGGDVKAGLGLGVNHELFDGLQLIGEVTPVSNGEPVVWAVGARYAVPDTSISVDLSATNAIGRYGLGTLVAQDNARIALGVSVGVDLNGLFR